jgi:hypothetical protein
MHDWLRGLGISGLPQAEESQSGITPERLADVAETAAAVTGAVIIGGLEAARSPSPFGGMPDVASVTRSVTPAFTPIGAAANLADAALSALDTGPDLARQIQDLKDSTPRFARRDPALGDGQADATADTRGERTDRAGGGVNPGLQTGESAQAPDVQVAESSDED